MARPKPCQPERRRHDHHAAEPRAHELSRRGLLRAHPELDETPGKYPGNAGIYCRSYCPLHPKVHEIVFDLIDELVEATGADAFHAGTA